MVNPAPLASSTNSLSLVPLLEVGVVREYAHVDANQLRCFCGVRVHQQDTLDANKVPGRQCVVIVLEQLGLAVRHHNSS
jgi:hypothetical protein